MPIFARETSDGRWQPSPLAAGPFAGLQGGAVAGLLTAEIEAAARERGWGPAVQASVWFLKPTPMVPLRTELTILREGGRATLVDNTLFLDDELEPRATARVLLLKEHPVDIPGLASRPKTSFDPERLARVERSAPHGGLWFMDAMEVRVDDDISWFRLLTAVVDGAGPLARTLGPADWAHGINRPRENVVADPNPNLSVHLCRPPQGDWIGVQARTSWTPEAGTGHGHGTLRDVHGEIGSVAMSVALTPLPGAAVAKGAV